MHFSSTVLLLATALNGAAAHPGHRHDRVHARRHLEAREPLIFVTDKKPEDEQPPAETVVNNSQTGNDNSSSGGGNTLVGGSSGTGVKKPFCNGEATNVKRATSYDIGYKGNTGSATQWGCNIMEVDCGDLGLYDYGTVFEGNPNGAHDTYSCSAFNKIGPEGKIDGCWFSALDFQVGKGEKKCIAFDKNSQGSVACNSGTGGPELTPFGQKASTWYEFDFGSDKNDHQSGSDVSRLVADEYSMGYIGMAIEAPGKGMCSWMKASGENFQAYIRGMEDLDGVGCTGYSKGQVKVTLGY